LLCHRKEQLGDSYVFVFCHKGEWKYIDASNANSGLGRYINDVDYYTVDNCKPVVLESGTLIGAGELLFNFPICVLNEHNQKSILNMEIS
jgi:hypothetical protein